MHELSVVTTPAKRRRYSQDFKRKIIAACGEPGASVARIAREHGLNTNLVHSWIRLAKSKNLPMASPAFVALPMSGAQAPSASTDQGSVSELICIEIPFRQQAIKVSWPVTQTERCLALLRELLQ